MSPESLVEHVEQSLLRLEVLKIASLFIDRESSSTLHGSGRLVRNCRYYAPDTSSFARSQQRPTIREKGKKEKKKKRKEKEKNLGHCLPTTVSNICRRFIEQSTNEINCQLPANERSRLEIGCR